MGIEDPLVASQRPFPPLPGGPDPQARVPRTPVLGFDLAAYAMVSAGLAEKKGHRKEVLASAGLDEARWTEIEHTWLLRLATGAIQGDTALLAEYNTAHAAGQAHWQGDPPPVPLETLARGMAAVEDGEEVASMLAREGLSLSTWIRAHRALVPELAVHPELASRFRMLVESHRKQR
jgi:hypothetical protein